MLRVFNYCSICMHEHEFEITNGLQVTKPCISQLILEALTTKIVSKTKYFIPILRNQYRKIDNLTCKEKIINLRRI